MRLGGPILTPTPDPHAWIKAHQALGYSAAYCPLKPDASDDVVAAYRTAAAQANLVIAEVGAWSNPLSRDDAEHTKAIANCQQQLALAERIGARCCVNIAGSRGPKWDGPDASHYSAETFDLIVQTTRTIIDAVRPTRTFYCLETMPWTPPYDIDSYQKLLQAIDRPAFAVHFDPVNLINAPDRFYRNADIIRDAFRRLGPHIKSCHAKDITLADRLTTHLDETRPGTGGLDYPTFLTELNRLDPDTPLMLEHLKTQEDYTAAAAHVRSVAQKAGLAFR